MFVPNNGTHTMDQLQNRDYKGPRVYSGVYTYSNNFIAVE